MQKEISPYGVKESNEQSIEEHCRLSGKVVDEVIVEEITRGNASAKPQ